MTNKDLYGEIPQITTTIRKRRLRFAGHCARNKADPVSQLLLWEPTQGTRKRGQPVKTYIDVLKEDTGIETTQELGACMDDREVWQDIVSRCSKNIDRLAKVRNTYNR